MGTSSYTCNFFNDISLQHLYEYSALKEIHLCPLIHIMISNPAPLILSINARAVDERVNINGEGRGDFDLLPEQVHPTGGIILTNKV